MPTKEVTILVPNYKTPDITRICLRLLRRHTDPQRVDVIAIDNDSADASLDYLRSLSWIRLIERPPAADDTPPLSHSRALDLALTQVDTPFVLSIHTDTFVRRDDWLDFLLEPFRDNPQVAGVGSWKLETKTGVQQLGRRVEQFWKESAYSLTGRRAYDPVRFDPSLRYLRSHCAMYRMDVIRTLGTGFSDGNAVAGRVMHRKMVEAGYRMIFLESERLGRYVDHLNHATMVLNPDLGSKDATVRSGRKRIQAKLRGIDAVGILADDSLDVQDERHPVEVPAHVTEEQLVAAERELAAPFAVRLASGSELVVTRILRKLPAKRVAGEARLDGRAVFVKIFIGNGNKRRWARELDGVRALLDRRIPTPGLISAEALPDGGHVIVTTFLADALSLATPWKELAQQPAGRPDGVALLQPVFRLLGAMHHAGLTHEDLHLGNFLASGQDLFVVDGDAVVQHAGAPVTPAEATRNLGMLIAQLPMDWDTRLGPLLAAYHEGHPAATIADEALAASIARARADRLADYMSKVRRDCTLFAVSRTSGRMSVVMREHAEALAPLLADPDRWIATGQMLKDGRSATVARIDCAGRPLVIKRCNIKGGLHALSRALRPSRAWHAWVEGHRLKLLGIPTPTPLAIIEERTGPFRGRAWLITEFCEGITLRRHFDGQADRDPTPDEADALRSLFETLHRARITHGDLKSHNLFWQQGRIAVIDLDAMVQHRSASSHERAWPKDRSRLLRNWPEGSRLHQWLAANLPPGA